MLEQSLALEVTGYGHQKFNCAGPEVLQSILALCSRMAASFEQSVAWEENYLMDVAQNPSSYLPMDQSGEEAAGEAGAVTLATMVQAFEESFDVYPFGEELIQEYIMYNLGVPFSKTFLPRICLVIADRFRSVLGQCGTSCSSDNGDGGEQGFEGDAAAKKEDEDLRVFRAVSLFLVKLESCPDAKCQLESALGSFDREVVNRKFSPKLHVSASNDKVRRIKTLSRRFRSIMTPDPALSGPGHHERLHLPELLDGGHAQRGGEQRQGHLQVGAGVSCNTTQPILGSLGAHHRWPH